MDSSAIPWLSETVNYEGLDNPVFKDQFDFMDEELAAILGDHDFEGCLSPEDSSPPSSSTLAKIPSVNSISSFPTSSTPIVLSFANTDSAYNPQNTSSGEEAFVSSSPNLEEPRKRAENMKKTSRVRPPSQTYDHIIAERKRREQLSQHFLSLSTIVPGLKKMDKTSVLGDAITYLKHLQERVKTLEEEATSKNMESVVLVKKSQIVFEDDDENQWSKHQPLPEIEARVCDTQILIRIQCENRKGVLIDLIAQVEKLNLNIVNTNVTTFGMLALEITLITKMEKEFNLTVNEVLKRLHAVIKEGENSKYVL